ncbi:MAG: epoxide hydrolase, soluble (sEH) [Caeruleum heppii]|nr:MAG: epoxide hydrolase, soluble (sEH) [Caeruleum heppii]
MPFSVTSVTSDIKSLDFPNSEDEIWSEWAESETTDGEPRVFPLELDQGRSSPSPPSPPPSSSYDAAAAWAQQLRGQPNPLNFATPLPRQPILLAQDPARPAEHDLILTNPPFHALKTELPTRPSNLSIMPGDNGGEYDFDVYEHGHKDVVSCISYNFYGKRKVTGSADHTLKVWDRSSSNEWKLVDTWTAHDAEIYEAKWLSPWMGEAIASIGDDGKLKIFEEDSTEPHRSGLRFRCIFTLPSQSRLPFVSMDLKTLDFGSETFIALLDRGGHLSLYEANDPESIHSWALVDDVQVCNPPARGDEPAFKVHFDPGQRPCYKAIQAGLHPKSLSLVTAAMNTAKVWRTTAERRLYVAAELPGHRSLVRDVAWAPTSVQGHDTIATASKDGEVRIFQIDIRLPEGASNAGDGGPSTRVNRNEQPRNPSAPHNNYAATPSGIGAGLAGVSLGGQPSSTSGPPYEGTQNIPHVVSQVASMDQHQGPVWSVKWTMTGASIFHSVTLWDHRRHGMMLGGTSMANLSSDVAGMMLVSAGDDQMLRCWKKGLDGEWLEYAVMEAKLE